MLPVDRKGVFFDCIKQRFDVIAKCGLVILIAALPLLVVKFWGELIYLRMLESAEKAAANTAALRQILSLAEIPCYMLFGLGFAAVSRILRQLIWGEPIFFFHHFKLGLKQNAKPYLLIFLLFGILNAANSFAAMLPGGSVFSLMPTVITLLFFLPVGLYMLSQAVFYDVRFGKSFTNGLALYMKTAPIVWIFCVLIVAFSLIDLIPHLLIRLALTLIIVFFALPLYAMAWLLYSCHVFDRFINPGQYPEIVGKGLYRKNNESGQSASPLR